MGTLAEYNASIQRHRNTINDKTAEYTACESRLAELRQLLQNIAHLREDAETQYSERTQKLGKLFQRERNVKISQPYSNGMDADVQEEYRTAMEYAQEAIEETEHRIDECMAQMETLQNAIDYCNGRIAHYKNRIKEL